MHLTHKTKLSSFIIFLLETYSHVCIVANLTQKIFDQREKPREKFDMITK